MGKNNNSFGEHLTIDGFEGNPDKLNNKDLILDFLNKLVALLKFKKLIDPKIYFVKGSNPKDNGWWVGSLVTKEAHINIHTFPNKNFLGIDIYKSESRLDKSLIINYIKETFDITEVKHHIFKRGIVNHC